MSIEKMKKIRLMAVSSQREEILRELMLLGCVEISEPAAVPEDEFLAKLTRSDSAELTRCKSEYAVITNGIKQLDKYAPVKSKLLSPLPEAELAALMDEKRVPANLELAEKLNSLDERIRRITADESRERAVIESLKPWEDLTMPLDCKGTEKAAVLIGTYSSQFDQAEADAALAAVTERAQLFRFSSDKVLHYVVLVCLREEQEDVLAALRPMGFSIMSLGEIKGTARENIAAAMTRLEGYASEKEKCAADIAAEASHKDELKLCADTMTTKMARAAAASRLLCTESVFVFQGWLTALDENRLADILAKYDCAWETLDPVPEEFEEVPVRLKNNRFSRPLNMVTEMYSLPAYDGVDPNPLMAPFFILFYGLMLADVAYGIIMITVGLLVLKRKQPRGGMRTFFELMFVCGISTLVGGMLTGGFFGNLIPTFSETFLKIPADQLPMWLQKFNNGLLFNPLDDTVYVLIGSMAIGFIQIMFGMIINFIETTKSGHFWDALMDQGSWWLVFAGVAVGALTGFWWVALAGVAALILTQGRSKPTIVGKIVGGVASIYNITGYFGDILSYSRIMALMLAGSVIAQVFNTLGAIPGNIFVFIIIFLIGHALNFALNLLGCYVHDLRLQCLEFFGKFYKDGGRPFKPLDINTKYYNVVK